MVRVGMTMLCLLAFAEKAHALEKYLCIAEQSVGFKWEGKRWVNARFTTEGDRYIVEQLAARGLEYADKYQVKRFGESRVAHLCERQVFGGEPLANVVCGGIGFGFIINLDKLRFQEVYGIGYVQGMDQPGNTPSLTIGTCTKLQ